MLGLEENKLAHEDFKSCPKCQAVWTSRDQFLRDADVELIGYQVNLMHREKGLFLFNHNTCHTTMAIKVANMESLYHGPVYSENMSRTDKCPAYCMDKNNLAACENSCSYAHIRQLLQIIMKWPKEEREADRPADHVSGKKEVA